MKPNSRNIPLSKAKSYAEKLATSLSGGEIIALSGPLGSGKTTFTKALGKALGVKEAITSPTFVMMQEFQTRIPAKLNPKKKLVLYHLDLYRTENFKEIEALGITHWWGHPQTITVIEWADKITGHLPKNSIFLNLVRDNVDAE